MHPKLFAMHKARSRFKI